MLNQLLKDRGVPDVMDAFGPLTSPVKWPEYRKKLVKCLAGEVYGESPAAPKQVFAEVVEQVRPDEAFAGKALQWNMRLFFDTPQGPYSFPFTLALPRSEKPVPLFLHIAFLSSVPNPYLPAEEILDAGFGFVNLCYNDVTRDANEFSSGIASKYPRDPDDPGAWGKIGMWAFAASRVMDYLLTRDDVDHERICVVGHSRLGKTALWCAAQDQRFYMAVSNDSGCSGAAITRGKQGERVRAITDAFPHWFCPAYRKYSDAEDAMPFDQHFLLASIAPRKLYVCSAQDDQWADPNSEYLSCHAASPVFKALGTKGFVAPDNAFPIAPAKFHEGRIGYHIRTGAHFMSRYDWARFFEFFEG